MKTYYNMKPAQLIQLTVVLLFTTFAATAQRKHKAGRDNTTALQEFARLGKWNIQWPVQINLHITHHVTPTVSASDSADTDVTLYYDQHAFYMQAEGMEQIANDSVLIMVNNNARMIKVFPNKGLLTYSQGNRISSFMPDTSLEKLSQRFIATIREEGHAGKRIILQSHERITGTEFDKEMIDVSYSAGNYQPIHYKQIRRSVAPVDSAAYSEMIKDAAWNKRLFTTKVKAGEMFFVVKEQVTECRFTSIDYTQKASPVHEHDRVVRNAGGEYMPAKGYEAYNVTQE